MKPFKKALETIGLGLIIAFATALILVSAIPMLLVLLLVFGSIELYGKLWRKLRHDPQVKLEIKELHDQAWSDDMALDGYIEAFRRASSVVAEKTQAKAELLHIEGVDEPTRELKGIEPDTSIKITQTLSTKHATVDLILDLTVHRNYETGKNFIVAFDEDEVCCQDHPPIYVRIHRPELHTKRSLTLGAPHSAWIVIALLRGDVRFTLREGQLWAKLPEYNVWIVQYKANKEDYGLRANFTGSIARKYGHDKHY